MYMICNLPIKHILYDVLLKVYDSCGWIKPFGEVRIDYSTVNVLSSCNMDTGIVHYHLFKGGRGVLRNPFQMSQT